jgi:hypothetical protein
MRRWCIRWKIEFETNLSYIEADKKKKKKEKEKLKSRRR